MHPIGPLRIVLPDELVEVAVKADDVDERSAFIHVAVYAQVGRLPRHVLAVAHTAHNGIQRLAPESTRYLHFFPVTVAQGLQDIMHQCTEVGNLLLIRFILDALRLCRCTVAQLLQIEVLAYLCCHILSFHIC